MKKIPLTLVIAIVSCVSAWAGGIKLTQGSTASLKKGGVGCVTIDMVDTKFDNKMPLRQDARFAEVDQQIPDCTYEFVREFNENTDKFTLSNNAEEAQYEFNVQITNLDVFVQLWSFKGGVGIKLWGTGTITEKETGNVVATYTINEEENSGITYAFALEEGFEGIAKTIAKRIKKGK